MGRPVSRAAFLKVAYWSRRLCGSTTLTTGRFNLSHKELTRVLAEAGRYPNSRQRAKRPVTFEL
jgi:hypothetical protein